MGKNPHEFQWIFFHLEIYSSTILVNQHPVLWKNYSNATSGAIAVVPVCKMYLEIFHSVERFFF